MLPKTMKAAVAAAGISCAGVCGVVVAPAAYAGDAVNALPATGDVHGASSRPIIFILPGQSVGTQPYGKMKSNLEAGGYDTRILDLKGTDVVADAHLIADEVHRVREDNPDAEISLVGHSAGGISAREYLKHQGGTSDIARYIAIGSPQYGSPGACVQGGTAKDLCPGSEYMNRLNAGDDTPGPTEYYAIRGEHEWADGRLDGGQCRMKPVASPSPLINGGFHPSIESLQSEVSATVLAALNGTCTGEFVDEPIDSIQAKDTIFQDGL